MLKCKLGYSAIRELTIMDIYSNEFSGSEKNRESIKSFIVKGFSIIVCASVGMVYNFEHVPYKNRDQKHNII